mmetsp:Transcript_18171/g.45830  ORF Transcript_18171/g.45830 Transcript_18171/m.45830 type:complete len:469 (-) Transcript_18171:168-1574(-)|eukprot:CAMPEP_0173435498 /NCGR_PEP_ID=MMETSP1357-20121228/15205_1 /TAXON_ID=77926 /ORGANISM="Hemiselmis rufescens, Strain PCC563" /LENGTH=468 /DNA_ID=CAMNT_0014400487 /DNA_START=91 /DNA_END=1497 /DNA_ORIENTATION=-
MRTIAVCALAALPLVSGAFVTPTPGAALHVPSLRGSSSSRPPLALDMQARDDSPASTRRDALAALSLLPLAALAAGGAAPKPASAGLLPIEELMTRVFENAVPSVCFISTDYTSLAEGFNMDTSKIPKGVGSGFVWDKEGHIVTNFHVINKVDTAKVSFTDADGNQKVYDAKLTGVDPDKDIAVLKIDAPKEDLIPLKLGTSTPVKVGQIAVAIGNPFGQDHTLTTGVVSGKNRQITAPTGRKINGVVQTDAAINPGNSGGPLLDSDGRLIGINTASLGAGVSAGVGFAIPIDTAKGVVEQLVQFGQVQRAVLGISYLERLPTPQEAAKSGIPMVESGAVVLEVPPNSPCAKAGMRGVVRQGQGQPSTLGDVIVSVNQDKVVAPTDLGKVMEKYKPNDKVKIKVLRGPERKEELLAVTLGAFKGSAFSKLQSERPEVEGQDGITATNVPLSDIAPQLNPNLGPSSATP